MLVASLDDRDIADRAAPQCPGEACRERAARRQPEPLAGRRAPHRDVGPAVAVEVAEQRHVPLTSPGRDEPGPVSAARRGPEPLASRGPKHRDIGAAVTIEVAEQRPIALPSPPPGVGGKTVVRRLEPEPIPG